MPQSVIPAIATLFLFGLQAKPLAGAELRIDANRDHTKVSVFRGDDTQPIVTQNARPDFRPYLHPIVAPDGKGLLTEYSPGHHKHQTGLYWGFTRVNGRDYFHHPADNYWKRNSVEILIDSGKTVSWRTVYDLLDADGKPVLRESQTWQVQADDKRYLLTLVWSGTAHSDVTIGEYNYGGLFLRMPWRKGMDGDAVNASGRRNREAEGQRAAWVDVGMQVEGRENRAHIAIFDHPKNKGFPQTWRVDGQMGVGPVRARMGEWKIGKGATETIQHRFLVYTGDRNAERLNEAWSAYTGLAELPVIATNADDNSARLDEHGRLSLLVQTLDAIEDEGIQAALMRGMLRGFEGRRSVTAPKGWAKLGAKFANSNEESVRDLSMQLSQIFGDQSAIERALALVTDRTASPAVRRSALRSLLNQQNEDASEALKPLLDEPALMLDAIRGYAIVENEIAPSVLLGRYKQMAPELRRAVIETLATRKPYAQALLAAVDKKEISRDEIPAHVARSLHSLLGERFISIFGEWRPVAADREKLIAKYKEMITPAAIGTADASRGRAVFKKTCASCHVLYDDGGKIGPELTGSNRANLDYILLNSVDPSYDVPDAYKTVSVVTIDGRVVNGVLAEEDATRIVLKTVEQPRLVIAKEDIEIRKISPNSMMPEGQLAKMSPQEMIDLIKYLRTTQQVELPE